MLVTVIQVDARVLTCVIANGVYHIAMMFFSCFSDIAMVLLGNGYGSSRRSFAIICYAVAIKPKINITQHKELLDSFFNPNQPISQKQFSKRLFKYYCLMIGTLPKYDP